MLCARTSGGHHGRSGVSNRATSTRASSTFASASSDQSGPYFAPTRTSNRLGIAYGGLLHLTGDPDRPRCDPGSPCRDYLTGVFAACAAVAGLYGRDIGDADARAAAKGASGAVGR